MTEFVRFVAVGGTAAAVNVGTRVGFSVFMPYEVALVPAYLCGMATAFLLSRRFVFAGAAGGRVHGQALRFTLVNLVALAQVWLVSVVLARLVFPYLGFAFHPDTVAHMIAVASPIVTSYFGHKHFSFAAKTAG